MILRSYRTEQYEIAHTVNYGGSIPQTELPGPIFTSFASLSCPVSTLPLCHAVFVARPYVTMEHKRAELNVLRITGFTS